MQFDPERRAWIALRGLALWPRTAWANAGRSQAMVAVPLLLALLALSPRLYGLADKPLWYDEVLTLNRARLGFVALVIDALKNKHSPAYFLLVAPFAWSDNPEWALRLPSAVFGAVCVFLVARLAVKLRGPLAGVVAGLLMALSPFEVQFGQEARAYTLISCLVLIAVSGLTALAQRPGSAAVPVMRRDGLRGAWAAYVFGTVGAVLMENNTIPWLVASNLALPVIAHHAASGRSGLLRNWAWAQAAILIAWLPLLIAMFWVNRNNVLAGYGWIPKTTWESLRSTVAALYMFRISDMMSFRLLPTVLPGFGAVVVVLAALGAWRLRAEAAVLAVIGLAFLAMPISILAISVFKPLLVPRYLEWSTGPYFVLAGIGATALPKRAARVLAVLLAVGAAACLAPYYVAETKPRWDQATAYLARNARPEDAIFAQNQSVEFMLASYSGRVGLQLPILVWNPRDDVRCVVPGQRSWVVYGQVGQAVPEAEQHFQQKWTAFGSPARQIRIGSHLLILRFDNPPLPPQCMHGSLGRERHRGA